MNERIRELAVQAREALAVDAMSGGEFNMKAYEEKFAELIVRECAEVAEDYDGAHYVGTAIKQQFGVK